VAEGKFSEAVDAYQESSRIRRTLVEQDKSNSGWQRDLSESYNKLGDVLVAEGRFLEALDSYEESLKIRMPSSNSVAQTIRRTKAHEAQTLKALKHPK
jgi:tetratricopeptide (TPR) repeat protein